MWRKSSTQTLGAAQWGDSTCATHSASVDEEHACHKKEKCLRMRLIYGSNHGHHRSVPTLNVHQEGLINQGVSTRSNEVRRTNTCN